MPGKLTGEIGFPLGCFGLEEGDVVGVTRYEDSEGGKAWYNVVFTGRDVMFRLDPIEEEKPCAD